MSRSLVSRRLVGGLLVAAGLVCPAPALDAFTPASIGVAHANNQSDCVLDTDLHDVDSVFLNGAQADFGGNWFSNHAPTSSAVVCWVEGHDRAEVAGTLYNDSGAQVGLHVQWYDTTGTRVSSAVNSLAPCWNWGGPCSRHIGAGNNGAYEGDNVNRVRIRTFVVDTETGARTYSAPQNRYYAV